MANARRSFYSLRVQSVSNREFIKHGSILLRSSRSYAIGVVWGINLEVLDRANNTIVSVSGTNLNAIRPDVSRIKQLARLINFYSAIVSRVLGIKAHGIERRNDHFFY